MEWVIAVPFIDYTNIEKEKWYIPLIPGERHSFKVIPRSEPLIKWHDRSTKYTPFKDWLVYWEHGKRALKESNGGILTAFPQLAAVLGMQQHLSFQKRKPVIVWFFNIGTLHYDIRQLLAKVSLSNIDLFIVQTRREQEIYSKWLNLPIDKFQFIPFDMPPIEIEYEENNDKPFIISLGSAHRDFPILFQAVEKLNLPTVVATGKKALEGIDVPSNVDTPFGISQKECRHLAQQARINVIPLKPKEDITAAGLSAIVEGMFMGNALIATACNGAEDYIIHGETGLLVEPNSVDSMIEAIEMLWYDDALRQRLSQAAKQYAEENFTPEKAATRLAQILDHVSDAVGIY
jgi:glycosyltransferase involved in cell wall biosynthesis